MARGLKNAFRNQSFMSSYSSMNSAGSGSSNDFNREVDFAVDMILQEITPGDQFTPGQQESVEALGESQQSFSLPADSPFDNSFVATEQFDIPSKAKKETVKIPKDVLKKRERGAPKPPRTPVSPQKSRLRDQIASAPKTPRLNRSSTRLDYAPSSPRRLSRSSTRLDYSSSPKSPRRKRSGGGEASKSHSDIGYKAPMDVDDEYESKTSKEKTSGDSLISPSISKSKDSKEKRSGSGERRESVPKTPRRRSSKDSDERVSKTPKKSSSSGCDKDETKTPRRKSKSDDNDEQTQKTRRKSSDTKDRNGSPTRSPSRRSSSKDSSSRDRSEIHRRSPGRRRSSKDSSSRDRSESPRQSPGRRRSSKGVNPRERSESPRQSPGRRRSSKGASSRERSESPRQSPGRRRSSSGGRDTKRRKDPAASKTPRSKHASISDLGEWKKSPRKSSNKYSSCSELEIPKTLSSKPSKTRSSSPRKSSKESKEASSKRKSESSKVPALDPGDGSEPDKKRRDKETSQKRRSSRDSKDTKKRESQKDSSNNSSKKSSSEEKAEAKSAKEKKNDRSSAKIQEEKQTPTADGDHSWTENETQVAHAASHNELVQTASDTADATLESTAGLGVIHTFQPETDSVSNSESTSNVSEGLKEAVWISLGLKEAEPVSALNTIETIPEPQKLESSKPKSLFDSDSDSDLDDSSDSSTSTVEINESSTPAVSDPKTPVAVPPSSSCSSLIGNLQTPSLSTCPEPTTPRSYDEEMPNHVINIEASAKTAPTCEPDESDSSDSDVGGGEYISSYEEQRRAMAKRRPSPTRKNSKSFDNVSPIKDRMKFLSGNTPDMPVAQPFSPIKEIASPMKEPKASKNSRFQELQELAKRNTKLIVTNNDNPLPHNSTTPMEDGAQQSIKTPAANKKLSSNFEELRKKAMGVANESKPEVGHASAQTTPSWRHSVPSVTVPSNVLQHNGMAETSKSTVDTKSKFEALRKKAMGVASEISPAADGIREDGEQAETIVNSQSTQVAAPPSWRHSSSAPCESLTGNLRQQNQATATVVLSRSKFEELRMKAMGVTNRSNADIDEAEEKESQTKPDTGKESVQVTPSRRHSSFVPNATPAPNASKKNPGESIGKMSKFEELRRKAMEVANEGTSNPPGAGATEFAQEKVTPGRRHSSVMAEVPRTSVPKTPVRTSKPKALFAQNTRLFQHKFSHGDSLPTDTIELDDSESEDHDEGNEFKTSTEPNTTGIASSTIKNRMQSFSREPKNTEDLPSASKQRAQEAKNSRFDELRQHAMRVAKEMDPSENRELKVSGPTQQTSPIADSREPHHATIGGPTSDSIPSSTLNPTGSQSTSSNSLNQGSNPQAARRFAPGRAPSMSLQNMTSLKDRKKLLSLDSNDNKISFASESTTTPHAPEAKNNSRGFRHATSFDSVGVNRIQVPDQKMKPSSSFDDSLKVSHEDQRTEVVRSRPAPQRAASRSLENVVSLKQRMSFLGGQSNDTSVKKAPLSTMQEEPNTPTNPIPGVEEAPAYNTNVSTDNDKEKPNAVEVDEVPYEDEDGRPLTEFARRMMEARLERRRQGLPSDSEETSEDDDDDDDYEPVRRSIVTNPLQTGR